MKTTWIIRITTSRIDENGDLDTTNTASHAIEGKSAKEAYEYSLKRWAREILRRAGGETQATIERSTAGQATFIINHAEREIWMLEYTPVE